MAKARDVIERIGVLMRSGKVTEDQIHTILNGAIINGNGTYFNGMIKNQKTGAVETLSADRIYSIDVDIRLKAVSEGGASKIGQKKLSSERPLTDKKENAQGNTF